MSVLVWGGGGGGEGMCVYVTCLIQCQIHERVRHDSQ